MKRIDFVRGIGMISLAIAARSATASETVTYAYDGLGRLKATAIANGPNNSRQTNICLDAAGNRKQYAIAMGVPPACGSFAATNPVPTNPTISVSTAATATILLSTLATVSSSAAIASFSPGSSAGTATLAADRQSVSYKAPSLPVPAMCEPAYTSFFSVPYAVQNTPDGAAVSGTATISVRSAAGPRPKPGQACP